MSLTIVLDTNNLVSAVLFPTGNEAVVVEAGLDGVVRLALSIVIASEYTRVLSRSKVGHVRVTIEKLLPALHRHGLFVDSPACGLSSPDPSDTPFIDCAVAASADCLVTGNKRQFPEAFYGVTEVVNARQRLERLSAAP